MYRNLFFLTTFVLLLAGCRQRENVSQLKAINQSLENSNKIIQYDNILIYQTLEEKLLDPTSTALAEIWQPRATGIKQQADSIRVLIEELKNDLIKQSDSLKEANAPLLEQLYETNGPGYKLLNKLAAFKDSIPAIFNVDEFDNRNQYESINKDLRRMLTRIPLLPAYIDGTTDDQLTIIKRKWVEENFAGSSSVMAMIVLNKIENEVLVTEKTFIDYCNYRATFFRCMIYEEFHTIASLSSSYVKQGQAIEVSAGIGGFSSASKPTITINGKEIKLNSSSLAAYQLVATGKPGKYTIPVKFEFTKPDGSTAVATKELEYIIADEK